MVTPQNLPKSRIRRLLRQQLMETDLRGERFHGRRAAVLVPLVVIDAEWHLLFTRRSEAVNDHKGQVSFPGGVIEAHDQSPEQAALREAGEEIGLPARAVQILGRMKDYETISQFVITPVVAHVRWPVTLTINSEEVSRVFTIPLSWLRQSTHFAFRDWQRPNRHTEKVIFYDDYHGECLWGISARITVNFLDQLWLLDRELPC